MRTVPLAVAALLSMGNTECGPSPIVVDAGRETPDAGGQDAGAPRDPCEVVSIERMAGTVNFSLSPDGTKFVENKKDPAGIYQVYVGTSGGPAECITCAQKPGGPTAAHHKMMVVWHPSGEWLFIGAEFDHVRPPWISAEQDLGMLQSGVQLEMFVTRPDGSAFYKLTDFAPMGGPDGYTGPAITPDGSRVFYAQIVDGNIFAYTFGKWQLMSADFSVDAAGVPSLKNVTDVSPANTSWIEPGDISRDGKYLLLTLDTGLAPNKAAGMDQWLYELDTGALTNLNSSPDVWDEHGLFAPNSKKVVFMSSLPYPSYVASTAAFGIWGLYTDFMLMDLDGSHVQQLTHFHQPMHPEYTSEDSVAAVAVFNPDGSKLYAAQLLTGAHFPDQVTWVLSFAGRCGGDGTLLPPAP